MQGKEHEVFTNLGLENPRGGGAAKVQVQKPEHKLLAAIYEAASKRQTIQGAEDWISTTSEARMRELKKWTEMSRSRHEWLETEEGKQEMQAIQEGDARAEEAGGEGEDGEGQGQGVDLDDLKKEAEEKRLQRCRKWLRSYIEEHEKATREALKSGSVNLQRVYETIAYVTWYLDNNRRDFGDAELKWVGGLAQELQRLAGLRGESSSLLLIKAIKGSLVLVHRMCEVGRKDDIEPLEDALRQLSFDMYEKYATQRGFQGGMTSMSRAQRLGLFEVLNNLAVLDIQRIEVLGAKQLVMQAASLVRDDDPSAETFILNAASLIVGDRDGKEKEAESLMLRAKDIAQSKLNRQLEEVEVMRAAAEEARDKLAQAQLAVGGGASIPLPEQGKIFWVHFEDGQVENRETSKEEVIEKASNVELELRAGEKGLLKRRIPLMACIRKLGNLYRRAWRNRDKWAAARRLANQLLAEVEQCGGNVKLPLKDMLSNQAFLVDYYITAAASQKGKSDKRLTLVTARDAALEGCLRCSITLGTLHSYKRSAELYEKAAVCVVLCRDPAEHALDLALTAVRIRSANESAASYQTARALRTVSEILAVQGELEEAMSVALSASDMAAESLGEKHFKAKAVRKLYVEHKKVYLKCGSAGLGKEGSRDMSRRMTMSRVDTKKWLEEWLGV